MPSSFHIIAAAADADAFPDVSFASCNIHLKRSSLTANLLHTNRLTSFQQFFHIATIHLT